MTQHDVLTDSRAPAPAETTPDEGGAEAVCPQPAAVMPPHHTSREELLARYRRQRGLPEDPFENGARPKPPPGYRERVMAHPPVQGAASLGPRVEAPAPKTAPRERRSFSIGQTFAVAAAMALAAGAGVGIVNAKFFSAPGAPAELAAQPAPVQASTVTAESDAEPLKSTVITKKPVPIATLEVADAKGETNSFIPLALHAEPAGLGEDILLKISGVPEGAYLTSGRREEDSVWALTLADLKDVKLVVPDAGKPKIDLAVAAFEPKTGELAAPVKTMTVALSDVVVQPASAPPPQQVQAAAPFRRKSLPAATATPQPVPVPEPQSISTPLQPAGAAQGAETPEARNLIAEGNSLFKYGDISEARGAYEKAWKQGAPAGAYGVARSYDPVVLASLNLKKVKPDTAKALEWYQRAATAGHVEAAAAIVRLKLKP